MIDDIQHYSIDEEWGDILIDGIDSGIFDLEKYIKSYIEVHEIAKIGVGIVYLNARDNLSPPSGRGTMYNLYTMFKLYHRETK